MNESAYTERWDGCLAAWVDGWVVHGVYRREENEENVLIIFL